MAEKSKEILRRRRRNSPDWFILEDGREQLWFPSGNNGSKGEEYWVVTLRKGPRGNIISFSDQRLPASKHPKRHLLNQLKKAA